MDPHPHPSIGRSNAAGSTLFEHEITAQAAILNTLTTSTNIDNASQSSTTPHSHQIIHHPAQSHHQFVDSSTVYHHPFRTSPASAENNSQILDPQPQSKSSTPTNQPQTQSRPSSAPTSDWPVTGILPPPGPQPPPSRRTFSSSNLETLVPRESQPSSGGAGAVYGSPTTTTVSPRSSSNPNLIPSPSTTPVTAAASPYYQSHSGQDPTNLTMIATMNCSGLDVRPIYASEDSRHTSAQDTNQAHSDIPSPTHTRVPTSEEFRGGYYMSPAGSHYGSVGAGMLPSQFSNYSSSMTSQSRPRRASSSLTLGPAYSPYHSLSVSDAAGSGSYAHHHPHHSDAQVLSHWTHSVDSVRDSVAPYIRPPRQPSGTHTLHHSASATFPQSLRNGPLLNSQPYPNSANTHHPTSVMQYNAQGRPLAYMCNTCFRAFDRPSALQIHERSHTGERPFPCPWNGCVKRFTTHGNMVKHSRVCPFREPED